MLTPILIFIVALTVLLVAAQLFTRAAEQIGGWLKFSPFVIGVFIVGIGTSLPELISGIISTGKGLSEIVPGNIIGASISNILLITGLAVVLKKKAFPLTVPISILTCISCSAASSSFTWWRMMVLSGGQKPFRVY